MVKNNALWKVGELSYRVIKLLGSSWQEGSPIYIGRENIKHIKKSHLKDFKKYGKNINKIISSPTYVSKNPKKNSIEDNYTTPASNNKINNQGFLFINDQQ